MKKISLLCLTLLSFHGFGFSVGNEDHGQTKSVKSKKPNGSRGGSGGGAVRNRSNRPDRSGAGSRRPGNSAQRPSRNTPNRNVNQRPNRNTPDRNVNQRPNRNTPDRNVNQRPNRNTPDRNVNQRPNRNIPDRNVNHNRPGNGPGRDGRVNKPRAQHGPHWNKPGKRYARHRHKPRRSNHVYTRRWNSRADYYRTVPARYIYNARWVRFRVDVKDALVMYSGYPYMVFNGYMHRYSMYDRCQYDLVDGYRNSSVTTFEGYSCAVAYDMCAELRDNSNHSQQSYRYFCAERIN